MVKDKGSWLLLSYVPVSLFSLRMVHATSKGGKTLLVPTPYVIKMALIDACFRTYEDSEATIQAKKMFNLIKDKQVRIKPPQMCVLNSSFGRVKQEARGAPAGIYDSTIAYREFCFYGGLETDDKYLIIALEVKKLVDDEIKFLERIAARVNYFGKRCSFFQFVKSDLLQEITLDGFTLPNGNGDDFLSGRYASTAFLDDFGIDLINDRAGFERINTFSSSPIRLGKHRVLVRTLLPYHFKSSSLNYTYYERLD